MGLRFEGCTPSRFLSRPPLAAYERWTSSFHVFCAGTRQDLLVSDACIPQILDSWPCQLNEDPTFQHIIGVKEMNPDMPILRDLRPVGLFAC